MASNTSRLSLPYPSSTDDVSAFPTVSASQMGTLDAAALTSSGTLASLPSSTEAGNFYYATDTGQLFVYYGSAWQLVQTGYPARAAFTTNKTIAGSGAWTVLTATVTTFDPQSAFSSGVYVCPTAGYYQVNVFYICTTTAATTMFAGIMKNGSIQSVGSAFPAASATASYQMASDVIQCAASDQLGIGAGASIAASQTATGGYISVVPLN